MKPMRVPVLGVSPKPSLASWERKAFQVDRTVPGLGLARCISFRSVLLVCACVAMGRVVGMAVMTVSLGNDLKIGTQHLILRWKFVAPFGYERITATPPEGSFEATAASRQRSITGGSME